jgi:hypothetical protein
MSWKVRRLVLLAVVAVGVSAAAAEEYVRPKQVAGVRPCPRFSGRSRVVSDHGRPAVEVVVKMDVDVDGAPNAYGPPGKKALDIATHSISPKGQPNSGQVVGYMTEYDGGPPTVQGKGDPYPGYYVSQTDFADKNNPRMEDPRRYVDATKIHYVVQGAVAKHAGVGIGDYATVYSCRTGRSAFAIVGDSGNASGAEGSLALVRALGYPINDGIEESVDDKEIVIHYFPKSNPGGTFFKTQQALDEEAERLGIKK